MSKHKLLLADDSIIIQKIVNLAFAEEDIEVITVGDGDSAIDEIAENVPDIVLADVHMPGKNGYQICEKIREDEAIKDVPVILLVGSFEPFDEAEANRVGANAFVIKPFQSIRDLVAQVFGLLGANETPAEEPDKDDIAETDDIESLYRESFAETIEMPEGEEAAPAFADDGFDDEMIETSYAASDSEDVEDVDFGIAFPPEQPVKSEEEDIIEFGPEQPPAESKEGDTLELEPEQPPVQSKEEYTLELEPEQPLAQSKGEDVIEFEPEQPPVGLKEEDTLEFEPEQPVESEEEETIEFEPVSLEEATREDSSSTQYSSPFDAHAYIDSPAEEQTGTEPATEAESEAEGEKTHEPDIFKVPEESISELVAAETLRFDEIPQELSQPHYAFKELDLLELPDLSGGKTIEFATPAGTAAAGGDKQVVSLSPELMEIIVKKVVEKLAEKY